MHLRNFLITSWRYLSQSNRRGEFGGRRNTEYSQPMACELESQLLLPAMLLGDPLATFTEQAE